MRNTKTNAILIVLAMVGVATAETVVSGDFSIGLGKTSKTGETWTTLETAGVNTNVTGPFTLSVAASSSGFYGSQGTTFFDRVLATGTTGYEIVGSVAVFDTLVVSADYTGGLAGRSATPMTLVIDSVRVWASNVNNTNQYVYWLETTPGNPGQQANQALGAVSYYTNLVGYENIVWNPGERAVAGTSSTRTFDLNGATTVHICIDGIEVFGHVEYEAFSPVGDIAIEPLPGTNEVVIIWGTDDGVDYALEETSDLVVGGWTTNSTVAGTGGDVSATTAVDQAESFYRVVQTDTTQYNHFNIGLGYNAIGGSVGWNDYETFGANTYVAGDYTLTVTPTSSPHYSSSGATFDGRVLGTGSSGSEYTARRDVFGLEVTATYTGGLAGNGATPMTLVIDSISIHAGNYNAEGDIRWDETTPDNTGNSDWLNLGVVTSHLLVDSYQQMTWNPGETAVSGTNSTRTFSLGQLGGTQAYIDGLEIAGHIEYDAVAP